MAGKPLLKTAGICEINAAAERRNWGIMMFAMPKLHCSAYFANMSGERELIYVDAS